MSHLADLEPVIFHEELIPEDVHVLNRDYARDQSLCKNILRNFSLRKQRWSIDIVDVINLLFNKPGGNLNIFQPCVHVRLSFAATALAFLKNNLKILTYHRSGRSLKQKLPICAKIGTNDDVSFPRLKEFLRSLSRSKVLLLAFLDGIFLRLESSRVIVVELLLIRDREVLLNALEAVEWW
jgi:hypothetical protein